MKKCLSNIMCFFLSTLLSGCGKLKAACRQRQASSAGQTSRLLLRSLSASSAHYLSLSLPPQALLCHPTHSHTHTHTHYTHTLPSSSLRSLALPQPFPSWERVSQLDGHPADLREPLWGVTMATVADEDRESPAGPHGCHGTRSGYGGGRCQRPHLPTPSPKPGKAVVCVCVCVCVWGAGWLTACRLYTKPDQLPGRLCYSTAKTMSAAKNELNDMKLLLWRCLNAGMHFRDEKNLSRCPLHHIKTTLEVSILVYQRT